MRNQNVYKFYSVFFLFKNIICCDKNICMCLTNFFFATRIGNKLGFSLIFAHTIIIIVQIIN